MEMDAARAAVEAAKAAEANRYTPAEFLDLWSQKRKYEAWFDVEVAACRAMENAGIVPAGTADKVAPFREKLDPESPKSPDPPGPAPSMTISFTTISVQ